MRVFVFFMMMLVSMAGLLGGYRAITGKDLVSLSDFGVGHAPVTTVQAAPAVVASPTVVAPTAIPLPTPVRQVPTPTPVPDKPKVMVVANTDGIGVYLRRSPKLDDRLRPWVEGTRFEVSGDPVEADGVQWLKVKAPDGVEGFIPARFLVAAP